MATIEFSGDKKIQERLRSLKTEKGVDGYNVGFFEDAKYLDGKQVAQVAFDNEFGTGKIPERPFFRRANAKVEKKLVDYAIRHVSLKNKYTITREMADKMGQLHEGEIKQVITDLEQPPNSPSTIEKKGSNDPLVDGGDMRASVVALVVEG